MSSDSGRTSDTAGGEREGKSFIEKFERELSVRWLGVLGIIAILFAVVYSIVYAVQEGIIGPTLQIFLGVSAGVVMAVGGGYVARETAHRQWGWIVSGGGVVMAYFVLYASYGFETYREAVGLPFWAVLAGLTVIVVVTASVSAANNLRFLAGEAFLLGYVAAYLSRSELGTVALAYSFLLTFGILLFVMHRQWIELELGGLVGAYGVYIAWEPATQPIFGDPSPATQAGLEASSTTLYLASIYLALIFLCYTFISVVDIREAVENPESRVLFSHSVAVLNAFAFIVLSTRVVREWGELFRFVPFLAVGVVFTGLSLLTVPGERPGVGRESEAAFDKWEVRRLSASPYISAFALFVAILYVDVFISSFVGVALVVLFLVLGAGLGSKHYTVSAHLLMLAVGVKIFFFDWPEYGATAGAGYEAATFSIVFFGLFAYVIYTVVGSTGMKETRFVAGEEAESGVRASVVYFGVGTFSILAALYIEFSGYMLSATWAVFALALLVFGLFANERRVRLQALAILGITILKVFLVDMQGEEIITRVISLGVLGIVLVVAAFGYSKYLEREFGSTPGSPSPASASGPPTDDTTEISVTSAVQSIGDTVTGTTSAVSSSGGPDPSGEGDEDEKEDKEDEGMSLFTGDDEEEAEDEDAEADDESAPEDGESQEESQGGGAESTLSEIKQGTESDKDEESMGVEEPDTDEAEENDVTGETTEAKTDDEEGLDGTVLDATTETEEEATESGEMSEGEETDEEPEAEGGSGEAEETEKSEQADESGGEEAGVSFCPECGLEVDEEDNFCINCGFNLREKG